MSNRIYTSTCTYKFTYGPRANGLCGNFVSQGKYCDLCNSRQQLYIDLEADVNSRCKNNPLDSPVTYPQAHNDCCVKPPIYGGYCIDCLAAEY
nr:hypothetical protein Clen_360 [Cedratvirus lena]